MSSKEKISLILKDGRQARERLSWMSGEELAERLRKDYARGYVSQLREALPRLLPIAQFIHINKIHMVYPSVEYRRTPDGGHVFRQYTGVVMVEVNDLADEAEVQRVKQAVAMRRSTWMALKGASGHSVKVLMRYAYPDGTLPTSEPLAEQYHEHVYMDACMLVQELLSVPISPTKASMHIGFRMSVDEDVYFNPNAEVIPFAHPTTPHPDYEAFKRTLRDREMPLARMKASIDAWQTVLLHYETALQYARRQFMRSHIDGDENWELTQLLQAVAETCLDAGIPEEEAVRRTWHHYRYEVRIDDVRALFRNVYDSDRKRMPHDVFTAVQRVQFQTEEFMKRRYELRRNVLADRFEYRERFTGRPHFVPLTENVIKQMTMEAIREGIKVWEKDIRRVAYAEEVQRYNPIEDYLDEVAQTAWDGHDYIRDFAKRVPTKDQRWPDKFRRWMLGMVAQWMHPEQKHAHVMTILLTGSQGIHKSTYFKILLPEELSFGYKDHLDFKNEKDALRSLSRYLLINIDEFDRLTPRQQTLLKFILQESRINIRLINDREDSSLMRMASFVGTSNVRELLTDPTGSRRFICVDATGMIDTDTPVNYRQLYAQAVHAVMHGERTYFDTEEEAQLQRDNLQFYQTSPLEMLFYEQFAKPIDESEGEWLRVSDILEELSQKGHAKLSSPANVKSLAICLKRDGFSQRHLRTGNVYLVKRI